MSQKISVSKKTPTFYDDDFCIVYLEKDGYEFSFTNSKEAPSDWGHAGEEDNWEQTELVAESWGLDPEKLWETIEPLLNKEVEQWLKPLPIDTNVPELQEGEEIQSLAGLVKAVASRVPYPVHATFSEAKKRWVVTTPPDQEYLPGEYVNRFIYQHQARFPGSWQEPNSEKTVAYLVLTLREIVNAGDIGDHIPRLLERYCL